MVFKSYLTEDERSFMSEIGAINLDIDKAYTMLEMVDLRLETQFKEVEQKVLMESGTTDDMEFLFTEANEEAAEKKKGIVGTIVEAVGNLFRKISNFIREKILKLPVDKNASVMIDQSDIDNHNAIKTAFGAVESGFGSIKDGMKEHPWLTAAAGAGTTALAVLAAFKLKEASGKKVKKTAGEVQGMAEDIENNVNKPVQALIDKINSFTNTDSGIIGKILAPIKSFGAAVSKFISSLPAKLSGHSKGETSEETTTEPAQPENGNTGNGGKSGKDGKNGNGGKPGKGNNNGGKPGNNKQNNAGGTGNVGEEPEPKKQMSRDEFEKKQHRERQQKYNQMKNKYGKDLTEEEFNKGYNNAKKRYAEQEATKNSKEVGKTDDEKTAAAEKALGKLKDRIYKKDADGNIIYDAEGKPVKKKEFAEKLDAKRTADNYREEGNLELQNLLKRVASRKLNKGRFRPGQNRHNIYTKVDGAWYMFKLTNKGGFDDDPKKWVVDSTPVHKGKEQPTFEFAEEVFEHASVLDFEDVVLFMEADADYEEALTSVVMKEGVEDFFVTIDDDVFVECATIALNTADEFFMESGNSLLGYDPSIELSIYEESALNEEVNALLKAFNDL